MKNSNAISSVNIKLENIKKTYNGKAAVDNVSLEVKPGEMVSLLGPSGCGKTTTLRAVAGFEIPDSGRVLIGDQDVTKVPAEQRRVGMVFQSYALFPNLSVAGNIAFGLRVAGWEASKLKARVSELLEVVGLHGFDRRSVLTLSGGQRQRVALARALAPNPRVLLLDEPLSALDAKIRAELRTELRRLQLDLGITTLLVTHDQEEAMSMSDRVVVMNQGRIEQLGTPRDLYATPASPFVAAFVGAMNLMPAEALGNSNFRVSGQVVNIPNLENKSGRLGVRPEVIELKPLEAGQVRQAGQAASPQAVIELIKSQDGVYRELHEQTTSLQLYGQTVALQGVIELVTYLGADQQVILKVGGDTWVARVENDQVFARGQHVALEIPSIAWLWLPA